MSCAPTMTLAEIDAAIAELEAALRSRLGGKTATEVAYTGNAGTNSVKFSMASLTDIRAEIARLQLMRSNITGCPSGLGPIRVGFGART